MGQDEVDALLAEAEALAVEVSGEPAAAQTAPPPAPGPPIEVPRPAPAPLRNLPPGLQRILQLEVPVIVKLGDRNLTMAEVLELNVGTILEFDKRFDAELELLVTNRQIGLGQAVEVGENFGLRVTRIGTIYETIQALGG